MNQMKVSFSLIWMIVESLSNEEKIAKMNQKKVFFSLLWMNYSREMLKEFDKKEDIIDNINSTKSITRKTWVFVILFVLFFLKEKLELLECCSFFTFLYVLSFPTFFPLISSQQECTFLLLIFQSVEWMHFGNKIFDVLSYSPFPSCVISLSISDPSLFFIFIKCGFHSSIVSKYIFVSIGINFR